MLVFIVLYYLLFIVSIFFVLRSLCLGVVPSPTPHPCLPPFFFRELAGGKNKSCKSTEREDILRVERERGGGGKRIYIAPAPREYRANHLACLRKASPHKHPRSSFGRRRRKWRVRQISPIILLLLNKRQFHHLVLGFSIL